jgi:hypothetical protein
VPKVHNKPIKRPRKDSNKESKRQPKSPLVWRTGLSGAPGSPNSELLTFENSESRSAIIHQTVRCSTGLSGAPAEQRLLRANSRLQRTLNTLQCEQKSEQSQKAHRTVNSDCPVHHRTVRWPRYQKLQRSESNGLVTWLAHRTVSGGAPDCPVRHTTAASTNGSFGGWGYKYPQPPTIHCIQVFRLPTPYKSYNIQYKTHQRDQILSQVQRSFQSNSD